MNRSDIDGLERRLAEIAHRHDLADAERARQRLTAKLAQMADNLKESVALMEELSSRPAGHDEDAAGSDSASAQTPTR